MIAVAAPYAKRRWVVDYTTTRYGSAPIRVYYDTRGVFWGAIRRVSSYPAHVFFNARGRRVSSLPGYPFAATPKTFSGSGLSATGEGGASD